jgi:membrane-anchored glycerophosphoryl diester phosphodiesterase (GDPDase)
MGPINNEPKDKPTMTTKHDSLLASNLGFDEYDMEENRAGRLSEKQAAALKLLRLKTNLALVAALVMLTVILGPLFMSTMNWNTAVAVAVAALYLSLAALFYTFMRSTTHAITADLNAEHIEGAQGQIQCYISRRSYTLRMGDVTFSNIAQNVYTAFRHLEVYTVYYTPHSKHLLAAEAVADSRKRA